MLFFVELIAPKIDSGGMADVIFFILGLPFFAAASGKQSSLFDRSSLNLGFYRIFAATPIFFLLIIATVLFFFLASFLDNAKLPGRHDLHQDFLLPQE